MTSDRFELSVDFTRQYILAFYSRQPIIDSCVDQLENGDAKIVNCPDVSRSYTEYTRCRVYFKNETLLGIEFV